MERPERGSRNQNSKEGEVEMKKVKKLNKVELELVRADMAFLIEQEKKSGDWKKWLESQQEWGRNKFKSNREIHDPDPRVNSLVELAYGPDPRVHPESKIRKARNNKVK
jgi:hypothetical protein